MNMTNTRLINGINWVNIAEKSTVADIHLTYLNNPRNSFSNDITMNIANTVPIKGISCVRTCVKSVVVVVV